MLGSGAGFGCGNACPDDSFGTLDVRFFDTIPAPFRHDVQSKFAAAQIDLKAVDFKSLSSINYGAKLVGAPDGSHFGLAWYRDLGDDATGTAFHLDHRFGDVTLGVTHSIANTDPLKDTNLYRAGTAHTANTVAAFSAPLLAHGAVRVYGRYGTVAPNGAHDAVAALSYSPLDAGFAVDELGGHWRPFLGLGMRTIDPGYAPLGTAYDPFIGTHSAFATVGYERFGADDAKKPKAQLVLTGVRAWDDVRPRYGAVSAQLSLTLGRTANAMTGTISHVRSDIAASIFARQAANVLLTPAEGLAMLRNDSDSLSFKGMLGRFTLSAGPTWTNSPKKCSASATPKCATAYTRAINYGVSRNDDLYVEFSAKLAPLQQQQFDQKSVAGNQLDTKGVAAYQGWCGSAHFPLRIEPAFTYDSNISQGSSAYVPGHLSEAYVDVAGRHAALAVRFSYKQIVDQSVSTASLSQHAFYVGIASDALTRRALAYCANKGRLGGAAAGPELASSP